MTEKEVKCKGMKVKGKRDVIINPITIYIVRETFARSLIDCVHAMQKMKLTPLQIIQLDVFP